MADPFDKTMPGLESPASDGTAVTPADGTDLPTSTRGLWIGGAGTVVVITVRGTTLTFAGALGGSVIPVRAARVKATGTTATNIVALHD